jgi:GntR family transcriptional regulator, transcriptional repressor for pyruvate dehydrogenase complex
LELRTAPEQIADRVATAIVLGEFVPGQRLPSQRDLASQLHVSRATAREALQRLVASGYIEIRRGRTGGASVREDWRPDSAAVVRRTLMTRWDRFEDLLDFRRLLEPVIARTAAERADTTDVAAVRDALDRYRAAGKDREKSRAADEALHMAVARASHNAYLLALSSRMREEIGLGFSAEPYNAAIRRAALIDHGELAEAIMARDVERAGSVADRHFTLTERAIRDLASRVDAP